MATDLFYSQVGMLIAVMLSKKAQMRDTVVS